MPGLQPGEQSESRIAQPPSIRFEPESSEIIQPIRLNPIHQATAATADGTRFYANL